MTSGGFGGGSSDPFGSDPFGGPPSGGTPGYGQSPTNYGAPISHPPVYGLGGFGGSGDSFGGGGFGAPPPSDEVNTLSTLSIVFAVVFAPVGALLGHLALRQIRERGQRGRERAVVGLTLSYVIVVVAIIALVLWLLASDDAASTVATSTPTTTTTTATAPSLPPPPRTTVVTAAPTTRPTVKVEALRVGDCVEFTQQEPIPGEPSKDYTDIYRAACQVRDGIFQVTSLVGSQSGCATRYLFNNERTIYACLTDFKG